MVTNRAEKQGTYVIRVPCKEKKGTLYRLQSTWDGEHIKIIILDGTMAFRSFVSLLCDFVLHCAIMCLFFRKGHEV